MIGPSPDQVAWLEFHSRHVNIGRWQVIWWPRSWPLCFWGGRLGGLHWYFYLWPLEVRCLRFLR